MIIDDDNDKPSLALPTLTMLIIVAGACAMLFWIPLLSYAWHWWIP